MFRWKTLAGLVLAATVLVAPASADALTLSQRVAKVEAKLACLQWTGISEYDGFAPYYGGDGTYSYDPWGSWTAASMDDANGGGHQDYRLAVIKPTSTCRAKFAKAANPYLGIFAAARSAEQLERVEKIGITG